MYLSSPGSPNPPPSVAQRQGLRHARRDRRAARRASRSDRPVGCPDASTGNSCRFCRANAAAQQLRRGARDAPLKQRALGPGIDDGGAELPQRADRALDEVDALLVGLGQQLAIQVLAHDADAQARQRRARSWTEIRRARRAADAERRVLVLRVVAGNHVENPRRVLHRAADRPDAHVEPGADHPVGADELLRRREADEAVDGRRPADGHDRLFGDRAGHQVRGHGRGRSGARHARLALGVVGIAERAAERAARAVHGVLRQVRLGQDDGAGVAQARHERRIVRRPIVGVLRVGARRRAHVFRVVPDP